MGAVHTVAQSVEDRYFSVSPFWVNVDYVMSKGKYLIYSSKYINLRATGVKFADIQSTMRVVRMKHYDRYRQRTLSSCRPRWKM